jgi:polyferredoxin
VGPLRATAISEPIYAFLRRTVLDTEPTYFYGGALIGFLFVAVVALNLVRARFWCRFICPLGALLGVVGKNPLVRLQQDPEQCTNCQICVAQCQGGADPQLSDGWKPAECFYCWNCTSHCPSHALSFGRPSSSKKEAA